MSRSNSEIESSFLIHVVHHPSQNLLPFPLCFHNLIYASLLAFKSSDGLFVHCDYFLFIQHWFIRSKNIYSVPTIFQVLVCMYQFKNKRKHRLKKKESVKSSWSLGSSHEEVLSSMTQNWVSLSSPPNSRSFLCRAGTQRLCQPIPRLS